MFARVVWAAVLLTVAITPLVFSTAAKDVYRLPKTLFFELAALLIGAAIVAWDANRAALGKLAARHRTPLILGAAAVLWTAVISMTAQNPVVTAHAPLAVFCYAVFFAATLLFAQRTPGLALAALLTPAVINAVVILLQWRSIWTPNAGEHAGRYGHTGLQGNPDPAGVYLIVPAIAAIAAAIAFRRWRPLLVATSALLLVGLLLTESITVFVTLAAVFAAFIVVVPSRKARLAMIAMIVAGAVVLAAYAPTRTRAINIARWLSEGNFQEVTSFRLPAWGVAWSMFLDHPLTGVGPGGYGARYMSYKLAGDERHPEWMTLGNFNFGEAHNDHLQLLAEGGLPGWALFALILGSIALVSLRARGGGAESTFARLFALPATVGFAVAGLAQFPLHLTAASMTAVFAAALALAWANDPAPDDPAIPGSGPWRALRLAGAALLCVAAALAIVRNVVPRYQCSVEKKRTESWLATAAESGSLDRRIAVARDAIPRLQQCIERDPSDYEALFLLGVARREAEQNEAALRAFSSSLALNERPETYTNVALLQLEMGDAEAARRNFRQAVYFHLDMIDYVDYSMRVEMEAAVHERQARLKKRVR